MGMDRGKWLGSITGVNRGVLGLYVVLITGILMSAWRLSFNRRLAVIVLGEIDCGRGVNSRIMCCRGGRGLMRGWREGRRRKERWLRSPASVVWSWR